MIEIEVKMKPEGWIYYWSDIPRGAVEKEVFHCEKKPAETLDECLDRLYESIRRKLPVGKLQGDETFSNRVVGETTTRAVSPDDQK